MDVPILAWVGALGVILVMVAIDLVVFHREAHEVTVREASVWTAAWIALGLGFGGVIAWHWGAGPAGQYLAGYLLEKSLAVDNLFIFAVIFSAFAIPPRFQHRILFWGVMGALVLRAGFIAGGIALLDRFHWTIYLFGGVLLFTAWRTWAHREREPDPSTSQTIVTLRRFLPMTSSFRGQHFLTREGGRRLATPLLAALVAVELADIAFAVDSVPAVLAVTREPFLVYTSNAFAILGLRSMYFFLAVMIRRFQYLRVGLVFILTFVGSKMMLVDLVEIPIWASLAVIVMVLAVSVLASARKATPAGGAAAAENPGEEAEA